MRPLQLTKSPGLRAKILLLVGSIIVLILGANSLLHVRLLQQEHLDSVGKQAQALATDIVANIHKLRESSDNINWILRVQTLNAIQLFTVEQGNGIVHVAVLGGEGQIFAHNRADLQDSTLSDSSLLELFRRQQLGTVLVDNVYHSLIPVFDANHSYLGTVDLGVDSQEIHRKIGVLLRQTLWFSLIFMLVGIATIYGLLNLFLIKPVAQLQESTVHIASGKLEASIDTSRHDEVGELARSVAHMRDAIRDKLRELQEYQDELEARVLERTQELYEKNGVLVQLNQEIEEINKRLLDSIEYAKVIQSSLLPDFQEVQTLLPHGFFIWQPRDIVGGDMLYIEPFDQEWLVVVMDCTGHGVPGALMTMVAATNLRRITRDEGCHQPADILKRLNVLVKTSLQQDTEHARSDDGLDAAICLVKPQEQPLLFAGAKLPLYYLHQDQIQMIKGDKQSLGYKRSEVKFTFTTHTIPLEVGMTFYLATDGLIDQLGGPKRLPLGNQRFQAWLLEHRQKPVAEQEVPLLKAFQEYQGANERQDDVTVVGFMVK